MTTVHGTTERAAPAHHHGILAGWLLAIGGVLFFAGGMGHPKEDPPDVSLKEHVRIMAEDPAWFPSHAILLAGTALIAAALVLLARDPAVTASARMRWAVLGAAAGSLLATPAMLLHLLAGTDGDRIAHHRSTPITDAHFVVDTITVPLFALGIGVLAVLGARTRALGNRTFAVLGVLGAVGYGLAGATFLLTDRLNVLFPAAAGIALWALAAGVGVLRRRAPGTGSAAAR